jgi:hypothetical protein
MNSLWWLIWHGTVGFSSKVTFTCTLLIERQVGNGEHQPEFSSTMMLTLKPSFILQSTKSWR